MEPLLTLLVTAVLFLPWQAKVSAVKRVYMDTAFLLTSPELVMSQHWLQLTDSLQNIDVAPINEPATNEWLYSIYKISVPLIREHGPHQDETVLLLRSPDIHEPVIYMSGLLLAKTTGCQVGIIWMIWLYFITWKYLRTLLGVPNSHESGLFTQFISESILRRSRNTSRNLDQTWPDFELGCEWWCPQKHKYRHECREREKYLCACTLMG